MRLNENFDDENFAAFLGSEVGERAAALLFGKEFCWRLTAAAERIESYANLTTWAQSKFPACSPILLRMTWAGYVEWRRGEELKPAPEGNVAPILTTQEKLERYRVRLAVELFDMIQPGRIYYTEDLNALLEKTGRGRSASNYARKWMCDNGVLRHLGRRRYEVVVTAEEFRRLVEKSPGHPEDQGQAAGDAEASRVMVLARIAGANDTNGMKGEM